MKWRSNDDNASEVFIHKSQSKPAAGVVITVHAMFQNSDYLIRPSGSSFVDFLNNNGFHVLRVNLPGHVRDLPVKKTTNIDSYISETRETIQQAEREFPGEPIFLVGHSLGGLVSLLASFESNVKGVATVSSGVMSFLKPQNTKLLASHYAQALFAFLISEVYGTLPSRFFRLGDFDAPRGYNRQYWDWVRTRKLRSSDYQVNYLDWLRNLKLPILMISGSADLNFAPKEAVEWLRGELHGEVSTLEVSAESGFSFNGDHFSTLHGKRAAQEIWPLLVEWLQERTK